MKCKECGGPLESFEGETICVDCTRFGLTADSPDQPAGYDLDGDQAIALRDGGRGTGEDYACPNGDEW